jgi:hypothetical protein
MARLNHSSFSCPPHESVLSRAQGDLPIRFIAGRLVNSLFIHFFVLSVNCRCIVAGLRYARSDIAKYRDFQDGGHVFEYSGLPAEVM